MKPLFIILAQSNTGAIILILALLLVAGIIGYFTAWFYAKSIYTPVIKGLEAEKLELNKQIAGLKDDLIKINEKVEKLNEKTGKLEKELEDKEKEIIKLTKPNK
jgi:peptidoglycan hydrolase CwlO-like protein